MAEATAGTNTKAKAKPGPGVFENPNFDIPRIDMPVAFRELAEKGVAQARDAYEKMRAAAEESTAVLEDSYANAAKGVTAYNLRLIECARANTNAAFDFAGQFLTAKSLPEVVELSNAHARKQLETFAAQGKELTALAQKAATEASEPLKAGVNSAFNKVA